MKGEEPELTGFKRFFGGGDGPTYGAMVEVTGMVRDAASGASVPGVDVLFRRLDLGESTATSDASGEFHLSLAAGPYGVRALGDRVFAPTQTVHITPEAQDQRVEVEVLRLARINGRVIDSRGDAVADASVTFSPERSSDQVYLRTGEIPSGVSTDARGAFQLDVPPGALVVRAESNGLRAAVQVASAAPGRDTEIVIELPEAVAASGIVRDASGRPVAGATVVASVNPPSRLHRHPPVKTTSDEQGRFRFDPLSPGMVRFEARAEGIGSSKTLVKGIKSRDSAPIELVLVAGGRIGGRVVGSDGGGVGGAEVDLRKWGSSLPGRETSTDGDGYFWFDSVGPGSFRVTAQTDWHSPARLEGVTPPREDLKLTLVAMGSIRGRVEHHDGRAAEDFSVEIVSAQTPSGVALRGATITSRRFVTEDGVYELSELEPGNYQLRVAAPGRAPARIDVEVPPGGVADGSVTLGSDARLSGQVRGRDGLPLVGARVAIELNGESAAAFADSRGRYELAEIAPGRRSLQVSHSGFVRLNRSIELAPGTNQKDFVLEEDSKGGDAPGTEVQGVGLLVWDRDGRPVVRRAVEGGPAAEAGVKRRDWIVEIDGRDASRMSLVEVAELLRGAPGTRVQIEVERSGKRKSFELIRARVRSTVDHRGVLVMTEPANRRGSGARG